MNDTPEREVRPSVGEIVQLHLHDGEAPRPFGVVLRHDPGRAPFLFTQRGPQIGIRLASDPCVVDLVAALDQLILPVPVFVGLVVTKRRLVKCRASVGWMPRTRKAAKLTAVFVQEDAEPLDVEAAAYLTWTAFMTRWTRFVNRHKLNVVLDPKVDVVRKPLSIGKLSWADTGFRKAGTWYSTAQEKLRRRSFDEIMEIGKSIAEAKVGGLVAS